MPNFYDNSIEEMREYLRQYSRDPGAVTASVSSPPNPINSRYEMPTARPSSPRMRAPNSFSIKVVWDEERNLYHVKLPSEQGTMAGHYSDNIYHHDLDSIYNTANSMREQYNRRNQANLYNVYPRTTSTSYRTLLVRGVRAQPRRDVPGMTVLSGAGLQHTFSCSLYHPASGNSYLSVVVPTDQGRCAEDDGAIEYYEIYNDTFSSLLDAYDFMRTACRRLNELNETDRYSISPEIGSGNYAELENNWNLLPQNRPMPVLEVANEYSYVVIYNQETLCFSVHAPRSSIHDHEIGYGRSLNEAYLAAENLAAISTGRSGASQFNVWPGRESPEYRSLLELNRLSENESVIVTDYSIRIEFDGVRYCIVPPGNISMHYGMDRCTNLKRAYEIAFKMRRKASMQFRDDRINVHPARGSSEYYHLVSFVNNPDLPTRDTFTFIGKIKNFSGFMQIFREIVAEPDTEETENKIIDIFNYIRIKKYAGKWGASARHSEIGKVNSLLQKKLKYSFIVDQRQTYDSERLIHPSNVATYYVDNAALTTSKFFIASNCNGCSECNKFKITQKMHRPDSADTYYCTECLPVSGYYQCQDCRGSYHREENGCPIYNDMPIEHVYQYSQDVRGVVPRLFHTPQDKPVNGSYLRYGLELEVKPRNIEEQKYVRKMIGKAIKGHAIMKTDSSLGPDGIEIVTAPATLEYHRKNLWKKFFEDTDRIGKTAAEYVKSWGTGVCGTHVHITRAALNKMQLSKLLVFYHEPNNAGFLSKIAGREVGPNARYCKAEKKRLMFSTPEQCGNHHEAITISRRNGGKTAEVRIFRGNATYHGLMRSLEFVDATVKWCEQVSASEINWKHFLVWFNKPAIRGCYPELWRHILELGYIKTNHKSYIETDKFDKTGRKIRKSKAGLELLPTDKRTA